jgi:hydroxyacylglutathione hydrolase
MISIERLVLNPFQENTYILYDETKECIIIDPGCFDDEEESRLVSLISKKGLKPIMVLNTHLHLDHVFGCRFAVNHYNIPFVAHRNDEFMLGIIKSYSMQYGLEIAENPPALTSYIAEGDQVKFGQSVLDVIHVPGHSPGGVVFVSKVDKTMIAGDVLFQGSVGRSDLPQGDHDLLISGIKNKLLVHDDDMTVYPGHGSSTTIGVEKRSNPFLV